MRGLVTHYSSLITHYSSLHFRRKRNVERDRGRTRGHFSRAHAAFEDAFIHAAAKSIDIALREEAAVVHAGGMLDVDVRRLAVVVDVEDDAGERVGERGLDRAEVEAVG